MRVLVMGCSFRLCLVRDACWSLPMRPGYRLPPGDVGAILKPEPAPTLAVNVLLRDVDLRLAFLTLVLARPAVEVIVAVTAEQRVVAGAPDEHVIAWTAAKGIVAAAAGEGVVAGAAEERCLRQRAVGLIDR